MNKKEKIEKNKTKLFFSALILIPITICLIWIFFDLLTKGFPSKYEMKALNLFQGTEQLINLGFLIGFLGGILFFASVMGVEDSLKKLRKLKS